MHVAAFTAFNPMDIGEGYLGDVADADMAFEFSFDVDPNEEFVVIGQQILDIDAPDNGNGCVFSVVVSIGDSCL